MASVDIYNVLKDVYMRGKVWYAERLKGREIRVIDKAVSELSPSIAIDGWTLVYRQEVGLMMDDIELEDLFDVGKRSSLTAYEEYSIPEEDLDTHPLMVDRSTFHTSRRAPLLKSEVAEVTGRICKALGKLGIQVINRALSDSQFNSWHVDDTLSPAHFVSGYDNVVKALSNGTLAAMGSIAYKLTTEERSFSALKESWQSVDPAKVEEGISEQLEMCRRKPGVSSKLSVLGKAAVSCARELLLLLRHYQRSADIIKKYSVGCKYITMDTMFGWSGHHALKALPAAVELHMFTVSFEEMERMTITPVSITASVLRKRSDTVHKAIDFLRSRKVRLLDGDEYRKTLRTVRIATGAELAEATKALETIFLKDCYEGRVKGGRLLPFNLDTKIGIDCKDLLVRLRPRDRVESIRLELMRKIPGRTSRSRISEKIYTRDVGLYVCGCDRMVSLPHCRRLYVIADDSSWAAGVTTAPYSPLKSRSGANRHSLLAVMACFQLLWGDEGIRKVEGIARGDVEVEDSRHTFRHELRKRAETGEFSLTMSDVYLSIWRVTKNEVDKGIVLREVLYELCTGGIAPIVKSVNDTGLCYFAVMSYGSEKGIWVLSIDKPVQITGAGYKYGDPSKYVRHDNELVMYKCDDNACPVGHMEKMNKVGDGREWLTTETMIKYVGGCNMPYG